MKISKVCSPTTTNHNAASNVKNPNFKASLSLSKAASKTFINQAHMLGIMANGGINDTVAKALGMHYASYIDGNLNYLAQRIRPLEPIEYPIVFDLSKEYKKIIENGGDNCKLELEALQAPSAAKPLFELCPEGKHLGSDYSMAFNINFSLMHEQMDRLYYAIKERMDIILGRNY